jgi:hypothetical protein
VEELGGAGRSWDVHLVHPVAAGTVQIVWADNLGYLLCPAQVPSVPPRFCPVVVCALAPAAAPLSGWRSQALQPGCCRDGFSAAVGEFTGSVGQAEGKGGFHPRNYSGRPAESKRYYLLRWIRILYPSSCLTVSRMTTRSRNRGGCGNTRRVGRHGRLPRLRPLLESLDT